MQIELITAAITMRKQHYSTPYQIKLRNYKIHCNNYTEKHTFYYSNYAQRLSQFTVVIKTAKLKLLKAVTDEPEIFTMNKKANLALQRLYKQNSVLLTAVLTQKNRPSTAVSTLGWNYSLQCSPKHEQINRCKPTHEWRWMDE